MCTDIKATHVHVWCMWRLLHPIWHGQNIPDTAYREIEIVPLSNCSCFWYFIQISWLPNFPTIWYVNDYQVSVNWTKHGAKLNRRKVILIWSLIKSDLRYKLQIESGENVLSIQTIDHSGLPQLGWSFSCISLIYFTDLDHLWLTPVPINRQSCTHARFRISRKK